MGKRNLYKVLQRLSRESRLSWNHWAFEGALLERVACWGGSGSVACAGSWDKIFRAEIGGVGMFLIARRHP